MRARRWILLKRLYQEGEPSKGRVGLFQIDRAPYEIAAARSAARSVPSRPHKAVARLGTWPRPRRWRKKTTMMRYQPNAHGAGGRSKQAELNLSWTTVTAPVAGGRSRGETEGNLISTADSLLTNVQQVNRPCALRWARTIWPGFRRGGDG